MATTLEAFKILAINLYENIDIIPGSHLIKNYIKRSYQNDPFRVALEALLLFFAVKYMTNKKYQLNSNYVKLTEKVAKFIYSIFTFSQEIDELVEEWKPEPLIAKVKDQEAEEEENITIKEYKSKLLNAFTIDF